MTELRPAPCASNCAALGQRTDAGRRAAGSCWRPRPKSNIFPPALQQAARARAEKCIINPVALTSVTLPKPAKSVTHVAGQKCYPCSRSHSVGICAKHCRRVSASCSVNRLSACGEVPACLRLPTGLKVHRRDRSSRSKAVARLPGQAMRHKRPLRAASAQNRTNPRPRLRPRRNNRSVNLYVQPSAGP